MKATLLCVLLAGCRIYDPMPLDCRISCGVDDLCPEQTTCREGVCRTAMVELLPQLLTAQEVRLALFVRRAVPRGNAARRAQHQRAGLRSRQLGTVMRT